MNIKSTKSIISSGESLTVEFKESKTKLNDSFYLEGDIRISLRDKIFREAVANSLIYREYSSAYVAKMSTAELK